MFYGLSKVLGERLCLYYEEMHKVPIVRLRFVWTLEASEILDLFLQAPYKDRSDTMKIAGNGTGQ